MIIKKFFLASAILTLALPVFAQNYVQDIPTPDPVAELEQFTIVDGFEVNLYAADPEIANPIQINFDEEGRCWVAGSAVYPHIAPGQQPSDVITVLEDTDRDGVADKSTTFAEGLFIPTGIMPGDGGVYVCNSTELLHLTDTDGDGKADHTRVMLSGFGTEDTHHIVHTLHFGHDGRYYFNQSIYIHSHVETPYGVRRVGGGGFWRFQPGTMELESIAFGLVNSWGMKADNYGQFFATDGAGGEGINYIVPGAYYFTAPGAVRIIQGLNPGSPKHAGLEIISGGHFPEDWQGNMITNDFRAHRVCRFVVTDNRSGYSSVEQPELLKTSHVSFRPVDVKMGPDGALYIADWYNPIIQHGEVDFRDPRRDHNHGRIWRVTNKNKPVLDFPKITGETIKAQLELLKSPETQTRLQAKRVLKERGAEAVLPELATWVETLDPSLPGNAHHRLEALWMYQTLDTPNRDLMEALLQEDDPRIRAAAVRVALAWAPALDLDADYFAPYAVDKHPRVRLDAVRALGAIGGKNACAHALKALDQEMDAFLDYGLWLTVRETREQWYPALLQGEELFDKNNAHILFALRAIDDLPAPNRNVLLASLLNLKKIPAEEWLGYSELLAKHGTAEDLVTLLQATLNEALPTSQRAAVLRQLVQTAEQRGIVPARDTESLLAFLALPDPELQIVSIQAVGAMKLESARPVLENLSDNPAYDQRVQRTAIDAIAALGGEASVAFLVNASKHANSTDKQAQLCAALTRLDISQGATLAATLLSALEATARPDALISPFLQQENAAPVLAKALQDTTLNPEIAKRCVRQAGATGRDMSLLVQAFQKAGGLDAPTPPPSPEEINRLVQLVQEKGNAHRGERQYRRLECAKCHAIAGAGSLLGPDLVSIGGSAQVDYLVESLLTPNKAIKEGYHSSIVNTDDFETYSGIIIAESDSEIVLRDATNAEHHIAKGIIESREPGQSLMPDGLTVELLENEFVDLVRFLSELGRTPDFSVGTERIARTWRVVQNNDVAANRLYTEGMSAFNHPDVAWAPMYTTVAGVIPMDEIPRLRQTYWTTHYSYAQCQVEVQSAGTVELELNSTDGRRVWVNDKEIHLQSNAIRFEADPDTYAITVLTDHSARREDLKLGMGESTAQVNFVQGR